VQRTVPRTVAEPVGGTHEARSTIRVLLADDHEFVRRSLRLLLDLDAEVEVVAEARDIAAVVAHVRADRPHVLVLDVNMPGGAILAAIRSLRRDSPGIAIVVTTMIDDPRFAREAVAAGASGCVLKDDADRDLVEAIRRAARGESFIAAPVASALKVYDRERELLSARELDVLRLIALGHTNPEIGRLLEISVRTVETHRAHIHRRLGLRTRAELVRYAVRRGLLAAPASDNGRA
jgi:two-component system response regulator NreC